MFKICCTGECLKCIFIVTIEQHFILHFKLYFNIFKYNNFRKN